MTIWRCRAKGHTAEGEIWNFGIHVQKSSGTTSAAADAFVAGITLLWNGVATPADSIKQLIKTTVGADEVEVDMLDPSTGHNVEQDIRTLSLVGTSTSDSLGEQAAALCSLRTTLPTRKGRGRFYLPPMTIDASIPSGRMDSTAQGQIKVACTAFLQGINATGYQLIVYHRGTLDGTNVVSINVPDVFGTQRRRLNKLVPVRAVSAL